MKYYPIAVATAIFAIASIAMAQSDLDIGQIRDVRAAYNDAIARHDVPDIISFFDEEYQITTSLGQLSQDRDGEAADWRELFASRQDLLYVRSPESIEISEDYPLAAEIGTWVGTWSTNQGPVRTGGRYTAMWRQVDGTWKVRSELFVALYCDGVSCP
jgi:ketosteroid isomerase-like protein